MNKQTNLLYNLVFTAIMAALMLLFILIGSIQIGVFKITLALIPITIGAIVCGKYSGLFLGLMMGLIYLLIGEAALFMAYDPFLTVVMMLVKSGAAGFICGLIFEILEKKSKTLATWISSIISPLINTGLFIILTYLFLNGLVTEQSNGSNAFIFIITGYVGLNFLVELGISIIVTPLIITIYRKFSRNK